MPDKLSYPSPMAKALKHTPALFILLLLVALGTTACGRKPVHIAAPENQLDYTYPPSDQKWRDDSLPEDQEKAKEPERKPEEPRINSLNNLS